MIKINVLLVLLLMLWILKQRPVWNVESIVKHVKQQVPTHVRHVLQDISFQQEHVQPVSPTVKLVQVPQPVPLSKLKQDKLLWPLEESLFQVCVTPTANNVPLLTQLYVCFAAMDSLFRQIRSVLHVPLNARLAQAPQPLAHHVTQMPSWTQQIPVFNVTQHRTAWPVPRQPSQPAQPVYLATFSKTTFVNLSPVHMVVSVVAIIMVHLFVWIVRKDLLFLLLGSVCLVFPTADTVLLNNLASVLTVEGNSNTREINVLLVQQTAKAAVDNYVLHVRMDS